MRFIDIGQVKEGMIVGKKVIGQSGQLLLNYGAKIESSYIDKIKKLGYMGIYIEDELSNGIELVEVIDDSLRHKTVNSIKSFYQKAEQGRGLKQKDMANISFLVNEMLDKILEDKNILVNMMDLKIFDDYTFSHSVNVGVLSMSLGAFMNLNRDLLYQLGLASVMHDLGKVFIPKEILNKPGKLTDSEFTIMKTHSEKGYEQLVNTLEFPEIISTAVLDHHERYDGFGYPNKKAGKEISKLGGIIALTDVFDALTSDRPYRKALTPSEATEYVMGGCNTQFSEKTVKAFLNKIAPYPVGTLVKLSNGMIGIVMENYSDCCLRPKIRIIQHGTEKISPYTMDLKNNIDFLKITITESYNSFIE